MSKLYRVTHERTFEDITPSGSGGGSTEDCVHLTGDETIEGVKTFISSPEVPTLDTSDNSTKVANTAFVQGAIAQGISGGGARFVPKELGRRRSSGAWTITGVTVGVPLYVFLTAPSGGEDIDFTTTSGILYPSGVNQYIQRSNRDATLIPSSTTVVLTCSSYGGGEEATAVQYI